MENIIIKNKRVGMGLVRCSGELNFTDICVCVCVCVQVYYTDLTPTRRGVQGFTVLHLLLSPDRIS